MKQQKLLEKKEAGIRLITKIQQDMYISDYIQVGTGGVSNGNFIRGSTSVSGGISNSEAYNIVFNAMKEQVGAPYVWGGSGEYLTTNSQMS